MVMQFDQFARELDAAVRALARVEEHDASQPGNVSWSVRGRRADVALLPPLNVSVALHGPGEAPAMTWYPVDEVLVPVVARRIAGYLGEA